MKRSTFCLQTLLALLLALLLIGCDGTLPAVPPDPNCAHVDADGNGFCETCKGSVTVVLDFYVINDLHGKFADGETHPGVDELTTYLKQALAVDDSTILLSSGDIWQGASESNLTQGLILTDWMNEMDFVSMTLGNHEFDWGEEAIKKNADLADFPFLAINIYKKDTNQPVDYCQPSVLVKQDGLTIGIIGAIGNCYSSISPDKVEDVYFKTGNELTALVKAESEKLRAEGADLIVYSIHDGYGRSVDREPTSVTKQELSSYYDISLSNGYVDLVFEGHSHASYVLKDEYGVYHLQNGGDNRGISHVELVVNPCTDTYSIREAEFVSTNEYNHLPDDPIVNQLMQKYDEQVSIGNRVVGQNDQNRNSGELVVKVSQLYYEFGIKEWGDEYEVVLGGGYLSVRSPGILPAGDIKYSDLQAILPFDNQLVLCSIKGSDLQSRFIDNESYVITYSSSLVGNIDPNKTYYIVVDTYSSLYAPNRLTEIERYRPDYFARDLLADFIAEDGYSSAPPTGMSDFDTIFSVGNALADNATTTKKYMVRGEIVKITQTTYGNMVIKDENGTELTIYGTFDETGNIRFDAMEHRPKVGDTVTFTGPIKKYIQKDGTALIELVNASMSDITAGSGDTTPSTPPTVAPAKPIDYETFYSIGNALSSGAETTQEYIVSGRITSITTPTYGNMYLTDENGQTIYIYGVYDETGKIRYDALAEKPQIGDTVTLSGVIKKYVKGDTATIEIVNGRILDHKPMALTSIAHVYEIGEALPDNAETEAYIFVRAVIDRVSKPNYGEMYLKNDAGEPLLVYNSYDTTGAIPYKDLGENAPLAGDTVTLCAKIKKYVNKSGVVTIELIKARIVSVEKA